MELEPFHWCRESDFRVPSVGSIHIDDMHIIFRFTSLGFTNLTGSQDPVWGQVFEP